MHGLWFQIQPWIYPTCTHLLCGFNWSVLVSLLHPQISPSMHIPVDMCLTAMILTKHTQNHNYRCINIIIWFWINSESLTYRFLDCSVAIATAGKLSATPILCSQTAPSNAGEELSRRSEFHLDDSSAPLSMAGGFKHIWFIYGSYMVNIWLIYGSYMVHIWFIYG